MSSINNAAGAEQTEEEFFAYIETREHKAMIAGFDAKTKAAETKFWARHFDIDMSAPGADENLAAERAAHNAHFSDMEDTGN